MINGLLLIDKPAGPTSHDIVDELRTILGQRRVGHTGTLDPLATGLLVMMLGRATRLSQYLESDEKEYEGTIRLGVTTDTLDAQGKILERRPYRLDIEKVKKEAAKFVGKIKQAPPMVSAVRVGGRRLHQLARAGKKVERPLRDIEVFAFEIVASVSDSNAPEVDFRIHCSKGTYVRVLAADLGTRLGCGAHLSRLKRTRAGAFNLEKAIRLKELKNLYHDNLLHKKVITLRDALPKWPLLSVDAAGQKYISDGRPVLASQAVNIDSTIAAGQNIRIANLDGELICLAQALLGLKSGDSFTNLSGLEKLARPLAVFKY